MEEAKLEINRCKHLETTSTLPSLDLRLSMTSSTKANISESGVANFHNDDFESDGKKKKSIFPPKTMKKTRKTESLKNVTWTWTDAYVN